MALDLELHRSRLDAYGIGTRDGQINFVKTKLSNEFANSPSYILATVNGGTTSIGFHLVDDSSNRNDASKKKVICEPDKTVNVGDYFYFTALDEYWLAYNYANTINPVNQSIQIKKCNLLPFYFKVGNSTYTTYGFYEKNITTNENNEPINLPNDTVLVSIPLNTTSKKIKKNDYFYLFDEDGYERYQVEGIDKSKKLSNNGLIVLRGKESQSDMTPQEYYNLNPVSEEDIGSVVVTPSTLSMNVNTTADLVAKIYNKSGILMPNELVSWSSSATAVATVDTNGKVTAKVIGNCEIVATSETDKTIVGKCQVEILEQGWW